MTIALGILCPDGIVIAADSEYSVAGYMALSQTKIFTAADFSGQGSFLIVTGAGHAGYLEAIFTDLNKLFRDSPLPSLGELEQAICKYVRLFYKRHILPFAAYSNERPEVSLILSARIGTDIRMWTTRHNKVSRCDLIPYTAIGVGETYARSILGRLYLSQNVETAKLIAAYIVWQVKERIPDCGKETHIQALKVSVPHPVGFSSRQMRMLELLFQDYGRLEASLLHGVLGNPQDFADLDNLQRSFLVLRDAFGKINDPITQ